MYCDIRALGYVWVAVKACHIHHGATVYKKIGGKEYTLLSEVNVGGNVIEASAGTRFLQTGPYHFLSVQGDKEFFIRATPYEVYEAVQEIEDMGSDWDK